MPKTLLQQKIEEIEALKKKLENTEKLLELSEDKCLILAEKLLEFKNFDDPESETDSDSDSD